MKFNNINKKYYKILQCKQKILFSEMIFQVNKLVIQVVLFKIKFLNSNIESLLIMLKSFKLKKKIEF